MYFHRTFRVTAPAEVCTSFLGFQGTGRGRSIEEKKRKNGDGGDGRGFPAHGPQERPAAPLRSGEGHGGRCSGPVRAGQSIAGQAEGHCKEAG